MATNEEKDFVVRAIRVLRNPDRSRGIHTVYSGFNQAFRKHFNREPREVTDEMAQAGEIVVRPARGGVMLYLAGEAPEYHDVGEEALRKILGE